MKKKRDVQDRETLSYWDNRHKRFNNTSGTQKALDKRELLWTIYCYYYYYYNNVPIVLQQKKYCFHSLLLWRWRSNSRDKSVFQKSLKVQDQIPTVLAWKPQTLSSKASRATRQARDLGLCTSPRSLSFPVCKVRLRSPSPRRVVVGSSPRVLLAALGFQGLKARSWPIFQDPWLRDGRGMWIRDRRPIELRRP